MASMDYEPTERTYHTVSEALAVLRQQGKEPLAIAQYPNPLDAYLFLVLIEHERGCYVVWTYNAQTRATGNGDYFVSNFMAANRYNANQRFAERLAARTDMRS